MRNHKRRALIVVDVQNDFCSGGALAVPGGDEIVPVINSLIRSGKFRYVYYTLDWHPENHCSFKDYGGAWPKHCVGGSSGAEFHPYLFVDRQEGVIIKKGTDRRKEAYSGFDGKDSDSGWDLGLWLKLTKADEVYVCGLATDYCVKATALDARKQGFKTFVLRNACRGVELNQGDVSQAIYEMAIEGIIVIESEDIK
ncbi:MAG: nicotinamidase [Candidatus Nealsonbacteria bacterium]|nr:nicotinamidase [Candidatus Nealsonbacteria bacterium]